MVIADTGLWVALAYPKDKHHELAKQRLAELMRKYADLPMDLADARWWFWRNILVMDVFYRRINAIFIPIAGRTTNHLRICC